MFRTSPTTTPTTAETHPTRQARHPTRRRLRVLVGLATVLTAAVSCVAAGQAAADSGKPTGNAPAPQITDPVPAGFSSWQELLAVQDRLDRAALQITTAAHQPGTVGFGTIAVSPENRELRLYWKGPVPATVQALLTRLQSDTPVRVLPARHSEQELQAEVQRVSEQPATPAARVSAVSALPDASGVRVSVDGTAVGGRQLPAVAAAQVPVTIDPGVSLKPTVDRWNDTSPFWGGAAWESTTGGGCSTGFAINQGGVIKMLTAGHCAANGDMAWTSTDNPAELSQLGLSGPNQRFMGYVEQKNATRDLELINASSNGRVYYGSPFTVGSALSVPVTGSQPNFYGDFVCTNGARSGTRCNSIRVVAIDEAVHYPNDPVTHYLNRAEAQDYQNAGGNGDSGGTVGHLDGNGGFIVNGILAAGDDTNAPAKCTGIITPTRKCSWRIDYSNSYYALGYYGAAIVKG